MVTSHVAHRDGDQLRLNAARTLTTSGLMGSSEAAVNYAPLGGRVPVPQLRTSATRPAPGECIPDHIEQAAGLQQPIGALSLIVIGRSVLSRSVTQGMPRYVVSS